MTTIQINSIEGRRGSACNNDAYSIVAFEQDRPHVLAFVQAAALQGKSPEQVGKIFARAVADEKPEVIAAVCLKAQTLKLRAPAL